MSVELLQCHQFPSHSNGLIMMRSRAMNSEEEDGRVDMGPEELQHWVREQVEKNEHLVQRRSQLAQVEEWVKQKEQEATYTQVVYNKVFDSVIKCESLMKSLYGMLELEYRDTDSEEEQEAGEANKNVRQTADHFKDRDDNGADGNGADDYVVIDLGAALPDPLMKVELKEDGLSTCVKSLDTSADTLVKVKKMEDADSDTEIKPPSSPTTGRASANPLTTIKTLGSPVPISAPCDLPAKVESSPPVPLETSILMNGSVETPPSSSIPNTASTSTNTTIRPDEEPSETAPKQNSCKEETALPVKCELKFSMTHSKVKQELTQEGWSENTKAPKDSTEKQTSPKPGRKPTTTTMQSSTTTSSGLTKSSSTTTPSGTTKPSSTSKPSGTTMQSSTTVKPLSTENAKSSNAKQDDKPETKSPAPSSPRSHTASDMASKKTPSSTPADAKEASQTSSTTPATPVRVQEEIKLKVNMKVLGRRRTKTWHKGEILGIKTTESGPRYKIQFDNGKGKSVLSSHHLACVSPPMLKDLFVGCRVVARYKEDNQSWFHAAVVVEMPDRKNRMRFLVFFDDGRPAYIALPDLHMVCKPLNDILEDIEDEVWRAEVAEYLQAYPNPVFVLMRVGQNNMAERDGQMVEFTVSQLDSSLIQVCYEKDEVKEWLFKGSNRLMQIQKIKKRMAEEKKKEQGVNTAGGTIPQKCITTICTVTAHPTTTKTSTTTTTTNAGPLKTSTAPSVPQNSSPVTRFEGRSISQPKIVLNRIGFSSQMTTLQTTTHPVPSVTALSNSGPKHHSSKADESRSENSLLPVVGPWLKYVPHRCCPACLYKVRPQQRDQHRGKNPLLIPLLYGFRRMTSRRRLDGKMSFHVFYRAPCGRSMCDMEEVQTFLFESRCDFLFLDMFCLDPFVLVKRALLPSSMVSHPRLSVPDISGGKEAVPVRCVNEINDVPAPVLTYISYRQPAPSVFINNNLDFLVGCDCTDGCRDRTKCACYQMTIEATSLFTGGPVDVTAGYTHKRLPGCTPTGVYECSAQCRCDPWLCGNRLVQHGLQLRLEVFMTQHKGWGLRCLDDVSKGTFVCVFTGKVVDETAHGESPLEGNEYLLNLDYIEGVEKLKEDYESEAYCSETERESDKKACVTMTTRALKKHRVFQVDSSSSGGEELVEATQQKPQIKRKPGNRERKALFVESEEDDDVDDEDYTIDYTGAESKKSYTTRRNVKIPEKREFPNNDRTPQRISEKQTELSASMAKKMRIEGPGKPKLGFAKKSTRAFGIKSSHRRVKPLAAPEKREEKSLTRFDKKCTRSLFNKEKACYLIDAKHEGNLARFINHSCNPNLFVQNVFVDTHDLRFPWIAFFTKKRIRAGMELTWDYSYEVGSVEGKVLLCCCGSAECTGRLL